MRIELRQIGTLALVAFWAAGAQAQQGRRAQPREELKQQVQDLSGKVDRALQAAEATARAEQAVSELKQQVEGLRAELAALRQAGKRTKANESKTASLSKQLDRTRLELEAVKIELAGRGHKAGYLDGFFIRNEDNKYLLRLRGFMQAAYEGRLYSEEYTYNSVTLGQFESAFALRRARLELNGHMFGPVLRYQMELAFGPLDPGPVLTAWGELAVFRYLQVRFGKQKIPVSRQLLIHNADLQLTDRAGAVQVFAPGWDLGLTVHGQLALLGLLSYQVGVYNGAGSTAARDDNTDFLYAARLVYEPLGEVPLAEGDRNTRDFRVAVGGSFAANLARSDLPEREGITDESLARARRDLDGDSTADNVWVYLANAELTARLRIFLWQSEMFYRVEDPGAVGEPRDFWGVYTQLGTVPETGIWDVAARYSFYEPHYFGQLRGTPRAERIHEVSGALSVFTWNRRLRWIAEYTYQHQLDLTTQKGSTITPHLDSLDVHQFRLQAQLYL